MTSPDCAAEPPRRAAAAPGNPPGSGAAAPAAPADSPGSTPGRPLTSPSLHGGNLEVTGAPSPARAGQRRAEGAALADQEWILDQLPERLAAKVEIDPVSGCWLWQGAQDSHGYGIVHWSGRQHMVHRVVYWLLVGPIPAGPGRIVLDHVASRGCVHKNCCWPAHLEAVSNRENILRGTSPSAQAAKVTHCPQGHEYTEENTRIERDGSRACRRCNNERREKKRRLQGIKPAPPRTPCGEDIRVRLPIDLDPVIRRMAAEEGITPALFMRQLARDEVTRRQASIGEEVA